MPLKSKAQGRFARWVDENPSAATKDGIDVKGVRKFLADSKGQKTRNLPERVTHKAKGGRVSKPNW